MSFTYKGLKAELAKHIITDEELDKQIERVRQQNPRIAVVMWWIISASNGSF